MKSNTPKGFQDFLGQEAQQREKIRSILVSNFQLFGFEPSEPPIIEYEEFVKGENSDDEAVSDIFKLQDKGKRKLALRYEMTFQLKRIIKNQKLPYKRFQIGAVFRDEPVTAKRFRQFTQCDADTIGSNIKDEAEILALAYKILKELGINAQININNRKLLNEILEEQKIKQKNRAQVIKEIDKLDKLPEREVKENLKKLGAEKILEIFKKPESYFKKYKAYSEIKDLKKYCSIYGIKINFIPSLARGLAYYNGSVFEIKTASMKETICGGGSYPINGIQCTGWSFGLERLTQLAKISIDKIKFMILSIGQDKEAIKLAEKLRSRGISCLIMYGKVSRALDYANSKGIEKVIFVGSDEIKKKKFKVKDMETGKEIFKSF